MADLGKLKNMFGVAVTACLGVTAVPVLLTCVAFVLASSPDEAAPDGDPLILGIFGLLALSPLLTVPLVRRMARASISTPPTGETSVESNMMVWSLTEYALWEVTTLLGFVGFILSGSWPFLGACLALTLLGFVYSFPRWSRWISLLSELRLVDEAAVLGFGR